jgi:hypothetical protein
MPTDASAKTTLQARTVHKADHALLVLADHMDHCSKLLESLARRADQVKMLLHEVDTLGHGKDIRYIDGFESAFAPLLASLMSARLTLREQTNEAIFVYSNLNDLTKVVDASNWAITSRLFVTEHDEDDAPERAAYHC